ncbi:hypothetical protein XELAEV_18022368mg [Xenopus laevis]|uniref:Uncharacterized protein n=1 Tax=Xenopus laevis TaxID=8355 RepID=A0A974D274_XENLA|nr:hypothetical protein XELAEV_18022368mg [Xenopus laevis]
MQLTLPCHHSLRGTHLVGAAFGAHLCRREGARGQGSDGTLSFRSRAYCAQRGSALDHSGPGEPGSRTS